MAAKKKKKTGRKPAKKAARPKTKPKPGPKPKAKAKPKTKARPKAKPKARPKARPKPKAKARPKAKAAPRKAGAGLSEKTRVTRHPNVASRTIDGQEVVIVPSSRKLQMLNDVATRIWALCDGRTVREIVDAITAEYEVTRATALRDVLDFVGEISRRGMVEVA
jgi:hypothetical protein